MGIIMVLWGSDANLWKERVELGNRGAALRQNRGILSVLRRPVPAPSEGHFGAGLMTCNQNRRLRNPH
jgi:hypothetical protein